MTIIMMIIYSVTKLKKNYLSDIKIHLHRHTCMFLTFKVLSLDQSNPNLVLSLDHIYL